MAYDKKRPWLSFKSREPDPFDNQLEPHKKALPKKFSTAIVCLMFFMSVGGHWHYMSQPKRAWKFTGKIFLFVLIANNAIVFSSPNMHMHLEMLIMAMFLWLIVTEIRLLWQEFN